MSGGQGSKPVVFTAHARERARERGAREEDVVQAIRIGQREAAQRGLDLYRLNLEFHREWDGRRYGVQQVAPIVSEEEGRFVVITVYVFYFQEGAKR
jgi:hypothetical protein